MSNPKCRVLDEGEGDVLEAGSARGRREVINQRRVVRHHLSLEGEAGEALAVASVRVVVLRELQ